MSSKKKRGPRGSYSGITKQLIICPVHKIQIFLLKGFYHDNKLKKSVSYSTIDWFWCRKCKKPYHVKLVIENE